MRRGSRSWWLPAGVAVMTSGCFTAEFDPTLSGVFSCDVDDDCSDGQVCAEDEVCREPDTLPFVEIVSPSTQNQRTVLRPDAGNDPQILLTLQGKLEVVPAGSADNVFGQGHIAIIVDGGQPLVFDTIGVDGFGRDISIPATVGPHRVVVQLRQNDGTPYGGGATDRMVIWVDDGTDLPRVVITEPWPDTPFHFDETGLAAEVAVEVFRFDPSAIGEVGDGDGHVHVYTDGRVPSCAIDSPHTCSNMVLTYVALSGDGVSLEGSVTVPEGDGGSVEFGAILMNTMHCPYIPSADSPSTICESTPEPVVDVVTALRPPPPDAD